MVLRKLLRLYQLNRLRFYCKASQPKKPEEEKIKTITEWFSRKGDGGTSTIICDSGKSLPKDDNLFHAIGATEELLSYIGLAREHANETEQHYTDKLKRIQTIIIDISSAISQSNPNIAKIPETYTQELEDWINEYSQQLPPPEKYILPGGGVASASLHVARAICRRTERVVVPLVREGTLDRQAQVYLNRLSDFLFTISRIAAKHDKRTENIYIPKPNEKVQAQ